MASLRAELEVKLAKAEIALDEKADTWSRFKSMAAAESTILAAHRNMLKAATMYATTLDRLIEEDRAK